VKKILCLTGILFLCYAVNAQNRYDIVIDEIMADPSPVVGLPNNEWLELKNTSTVTINLQNWRIGDATGISGPLPNFMLSPDSFVIICSSSSLPLLSPYGRALSVTSFPSLDNDADLVFIRASNGKTIHAVNYNSSWYGNESKKDGGWTLEMIDTKNPCSGYSNWKASINTNGGTPGKKNSVDTINMDNDPPELIKAYLKDSATIILSFSEPLDSLQATTVSNYTIDGGLNIQSVAATAPAFYEVQLKLSMPLQPDKIYNILVNTVQDCKGNRIVSSKTARFGIPVDPQTGEWIINEILFDPLPGGADYVEFYNNSSKIFDAQRLYIANRSSGGVVGSIKSLSATPFYIFPGDHIVVTEDSSYLLHNYQVEHPAFVLQLNALPSFPDDEGIVVALKFQGLVVDELAYNKNWQFPLLRDPEGVALERIDPDGKTQDAGNWHSAATTSGYGTPTYQNSQYEKQKEAKSTLEVWPKMFSPDNDGLDDETSILYHMEEGGMVANIHIYDVQGRMIRYLARNAILGLKGSWKWDGLDDNGNKIPIGNYIMVADIFDLKGKVKRYKELIVVAARLK
jgi:hypothetical protein